MSNFTLSDFVSRLRVASKAHLKTVRVLKIKIVFDLCDILYKNGVIRGFFVSHANYIEIYLKYYQNCPIFFSIVIVSSPGRRVFWTLGKLSLKYNLNNFSGFYIISTSKGLLTSNDCLLFSHISGEILLKVIV